MGKKLVELDITDLAFDGKSVAHLDGKVVFLKGGLPGERVLAEITRSKARYNEGVVREIIKVSDKRIEPVCTHFDICGGCTWQDLSYDDQLKFKLKQVADCLQHIGGLESVAVEPIIGSAEVFFYRNKMEFSFHVTDDDDFVLGLHRRGRFDEIFDLEACHLESAQSNRIVNWMRDFVRESDLPVYDVHLHRGYWRFLVIRQTKRTDQIMVNIVTNTGEMPCRQQLVREMREALPEVTTIVHNQNGQKSNVATGEIEQVLFGSGYIEERLFSKRFRIRANSFFQTNSLQAETLYRTAFDILRPVGKERLLDLYCGTGTIGLLVSPFVAEVVGVELVSDAIKMANENAGLNDVRNITFFEGHVKDYLKAHGDEHFEIVVVDPPRAGMHPKALKRLLALQPEKLLYISCNPSTFARDATAIVAAGYELPAVRPVDMFPHTMHIELVGLFKRI